MKNVKNFEVVVQSPALISRDGEVIKPARNNRVLISVDLDHLARGLAASAASNKSGRSVIGSGAVVAKVIR